MIDLLDEECVVPKGSDIGLLGKLTKQHSNRHPAFLTSSQTLSPYNRGSSPTPNAVHCFGIKHYAGDVVYNVTGWLDKNRDTLYQGKLNQPTHQQPVSLPLLLPI